MTIKKGTHAPLRLPHLLIGKRSLKYYIEFTESCRCKLFSVDKYAMNKLFGIGHFPHYKRNSIRIAWRYNEGTGLIDLFTYSYSDGRRITSYLTTVGIGKPFTAEIYEVAGQYVVTAAGQTQFTVMSYFDVGYLMRPRFGGGNVAPHDIRIHMKRL